MAQNPLSFLVTILFDLYLMVVLLRLWLQWSRADFYNPLSQFIVKVTNPVLAPLRRIIPGWGGFDFASLVLAFLVVMAKITIVLVIEGQAFALGAMAAYSLRSIVHETLNLIFWVMLIRAILSFVSQGHSPIESLLHQMTEPMLAPVRRFVPPIGGLDLSMLVFLIGLQMLLKTVQFVFPGLL